MTIIEVGAQVNGEWVRTPAELRGALALSPSDVEFWTLSPFTQGMGQRFWANDPRLHRNSLRLRVSGPNPWLGWTWHVNLEPHYLYQTDQWRLRDAMLRKPSHGLAA